MRACQCYTWPQDTAVQRDTNYKATSSLLHHQLTHGLRNNPVQRNATVQSHQQFIPSPTHTWLQDTIQRDTRCKLYKVTSNLLHHQLTFGLRNIPIQRDTKAQSHQQFTPSPSHIWLQRHYKYNTKRHYSTKSPAVYSITNSQSHLASETLQYKVKETLQYNTTKPPTVYSITNSQFCLHCPVPG